MKNIQPLAGKPLIAYTISAALSSAVTAEVFVSTDCEEIASIATEYGARVVMRPPALASDEASTEAAILHFLDEIAAAGQRPEWVMTLPPTSPLRKPETISHMWQKVEHAAIDIDCFFTMHANRDDFWIGDDIGNLTRLFPDAPRRQQDRQPLWVENSCIYLTRTAALRESGFILGANPVGVDIPAVEGFDINVEMDFIIAEQLMRRQA